MDVGYIEKINHLIVSFKFKCDILHYANVLVMRTDQVMDCVCYIRDCSDNIIGAGVEFLFEGGGHPDFAIHWKGWVLVVPRYC